MFEISCKVDMYHVIMLFTGYIYIYIICTWELKRDIDLIFLFSQYKISRIFYYRKIYNYTHIYPHFSMTRCPKD